MSGMAVVAAVAANWVEATSALPGLNGLQSFSWLTNQTDDDQADDTSDDECNTEVEHPVVTFTVRGA